MTNQNKAYFYDPITREFVGITLLDRDPLGGGFLLPANAVTFAPVLAEAKTPVLSDGRFQSEGRPFEKPEIIC